ncbi:MAG TPA: META domain-containing protein [Vicinamibacterales bacterium]|nr:META domain-containing protein [Vicinamibacterales bacterium]
MLRRILLIGMLISAGCSGATPTAPTPGSVDGVWRIISIQPASQAVQTAPVGVIYQAGFENNRVFLRVDCNACTGPFTVNGSALTIGPTLACTRAACATASYENAVVAMLSGEHQMSATLHNLTLSSSRGSVLLQR